jgi:primosomal protein N' (replication factor Y)
VTVPFGRHTVQGVVVAFPSQPSIPETKAVLDLLDPEPVLTPAQIELAKGLTQSTLNPLAAMIGMMLPPGLSQQADTLFDLPGVLPRTSPNLTPNQSRLLRLLQEHGPLRGRQIDRHFHAGDWRASARTLIRAGLLASRSVLPPASVRPKFVRTAQLAVPIALAEAAMPALGKTDATRQRRQAALRFLMRERQAVEVSWVYAESSCTLADLRDLAERELILLQETEIWRDPLKGYEAVEEQAPDLTASQQSAWSEIESAFRRQAGGAPQETFLLHGVTGSGKTELYLRAAQEAIRRGRGAIILVPEIALTPQTVQRFLKRFPGLVGLVHSRLSEGERYDTWRRSRQGRIQVIVGPRSALFSPLPNIGLIVVDECHDGSYYQTEPPFYQAVDAARRYARICSAVCLLGSATPPVDLRHQVGTDSHLRLLELPEPILTASGSSPAPSRPLAPVSVVDMRAELRSGNRSIFSRCLTSALEAVLAKGQQAILFLNRRGTSTYVFCRDCGAVLRCPRCGTPMTYHSPPVALLCHHCGYQRRMPSTCPQCGSREIRQYGLGSEKVEAEVRARYPQARVIRWDWETTRQKEANEIILSHFSSHRADILVGTQMLAKGLDLPLVTLVGIVLADVGLNLPDPFASERTFDVLTQVAGRAGRSALGGQIVLQTFHPDHYVIQTAAAQDYAAFYARELEYRRTLGYPPFSRLVRLEFRDRQPARAESAARAMAAQVLRWLQEQGRHGTTLVGPIPCYFTRLDGFYRWQLILRGPDPASLLQGRNLTGWRVEVDPISLL